MSWQHIALCSNACLCNTKCLQQLLLQSKPVLCRDLNYERASYVFVMRDCGIVMQLPILDYALHMQIFADMCVSSAQLQAPIRMHAFTACYILPYTMYPISHDCT